MREQVKFWRDPRFGNLDLLHAHYVTHTFSRHAHETYAIGVILDGAEAFHYRGETHVAPAGSIVAIHPGELHTGHAAAADGWTYRMLYPDVSLLQQAAAEVHGQNAGLPYFPQAVIRDASIRRALLRSHLALEQPTAQLEQDSRLLWALTQLVACYASDRPSPPPGRPEPAAIQRVREFLDTHYAHNPTLKDLAAIAHLSPFHLLRTFRNQVGMPPHEYLTQVRLAHARRRLITGEAIAQVASSTGFADQSHLTRQFKRMFGVTPGQYRVMG